MKCSGNEIMQLWRLILSLSLFYHAVPSSSTSMHLRTRRKSHSFHLHPWVDSDFGLAFSGKPQERETFSVIVWGATLGTRNDTKHNEGLFCVVRYGAAKSSWEDKLRGTGRVSNTSKPMVQTPTWNLGVLVIGDEKTELSVRVFAFDEPDLSLPDMRGKKFQGKKRLLGEVSIGINTLRQASRNSVDGKASFKLPGGGHVRLTGARGGSAPNFALSEYSLTPSTSHEAFAQIAGQQAVRVEDISAAGPLILGTAPLPLALQGLWWVTGQSSGSSLLSFGGPNNDGNGCSLGYISGEKNSYKIRAEGDRVTATNEPSGFDKVVESGDKAYYFEFDSATDPKLGQMYMLLDGIGIGTNGKWTQRVVNSEMNLLPDGGVEYPGSVVWLRNTSVWGFLVGSETKFIQVMDGAGEKIEPAWSKFVASQKDPENGNYPGWMFYKSVSTDSSPWSVAVADEVSSRVRIHVILIMVTLLALGGAASAVLGYGCLRLQKKTLHLLDVWNHDKRQMEKHSIWIH
jgi:hypothetical protein